MLTQKEADYYRELVKIIKSEIEKVVVDQDEVITALIHGVMCNGHVLLEGVPGVAKTLISKTMAMISGCDFSRIQFTADLLPTDIMGITAYNEKKGFYTIKGPIFSNFILADEINRAPPKVQAALLEAMQEKQVTIGRNTFFLPDPFIVLATQNPIESLGIYPLPEAQIDRFLFKIKIDYPDEDSEEKILKKNITLNNFEDFKLKTVLKSGEILKMQQASKEVFAKSQIEKYIVKIVDATRKPQKYDIKLGNYIAYGGSPRASIGLFIAAKARALSEGRTFITPQNVKDVAHDVLRHRLLLTYEGQAENIKSDDIITEILKKVKVP